MNTKRNFGMLILAAASLGLPACRTAKDVAVTSFRVIDAPANYVRRHLDDEPARTTTTTTTTYRSDTVSPGHALPPPPPPTYTSEPPPPVEPERTIVRSTPPRRLATPAPTPRRQVVKTSTIPYAKPVPGKPGFVYSLDPNGGYVDVTGIASGTKMKDPYTQKIFIVP